MNAAPCPPLHVHSHFSLLQATPTVEALARRAAAEGVERLALTDTNALYGMVAFARACRKEGVLPLAGMLLAVDADPQAAQADWVVLLARDAEGYRSLCRLSSAIQAQPDREQLAGRGVSWADLAANRAGLACLCGGRRSQLQEALRLGRPEAARRLLGRYAGIFDEECRLSLELHTPADAAAAQELVAMADRFGVETVAVQPVYCLAASERPQLRMLAAIERNCLLDALGPHDWHGGDEAVDLHWLPPAEMAGRFSALPGALAAAQRLAGSCEPFALDSRPIWPSLALAPGKTADEVLAEAAQEGASELFAESGRFAQAGGPERLAAELAAITQHGFAPFFLIVQGIVAFARGRQIPVSTRGSVANSLVAYCLRITTVDPLANELLFERFLNPARKGLPDIDLDFCSRRRDEVLDYVRRTYGAERVALVATVSTLRLRSAVRETSKALGLDEEASERLARLLPESWHPDPRRRTRADPAEVMAGLDDERERSAVHFAHLLVGQPDHLSVHPGGLVITPGPLTDYLPVQWAPKGFLVTQFDHGDVEAIGLPKLDLLGIRALTVLADAADLVRLHADETFALERAPLDDPLTADLIRQGQTVGVFQCESTGAQRTLRQLQASSLPDLAVANAFFKPGPAMGGMARSFVRRYRGEERVVYLHPALEPILQRTRGVLLFQEQILRLAREVAGLSWGEADRLRRGMSHFRGDEMEAMAERFAAGCRRAPPEGPGMTAAQARTLWEQVKAFAGYGFNQGHATAYAAVSYRSAYMKAHWPAPFLAARLANWGGYYPQAVYIAEARRLGILVRAPHINHGGRHFELAYEAVDGEQKAVLWMGLGQVRDLRAASVEALLAERARRPFAALDDLLRRVPLQNKEAVHLIRCGALDGLGSSRAGLLAELARRQAGGGDQLGFAFLDESPAAGAEAAETPAGRLRWEEQLLGLPLSLHPLAAVERPPGACSVAEALASARDSSTQGQTVRVLGARLPGWTGGPGFFLCDEENYLPAIGVRGQGGPAVWQPIEVSGRCLPDEWGGLALQIERWRAL